MKLNVLIVDDELLARRNLECLLAEEWGATVVGSCGKAREVLPAVNTLRPNLILLDIQMPGQNGLELMAEIRKKVQPAPGVIFTTAHEQYAVEAFGLRALDYLLKPIREAHLKEALNHARLRLAQEALFAKNPEDLETLCVKDGGVTYQLPLANISWVTSVDHYLVIHCEERNYVWRKSLQGFLKEAGEGTFLRIHRSVIVNRLHIYRFHRDEQQRIWLELRNGEKLKVSRRRYSSLIQELTGR